MSVQDTGPTFGHAATRNTSPIDAQIPGEGQLLSDTFNAHLPADASTRANLNSDDTKPLSVTAHYHTAYGGQHGPSPAISQRRAVGPVPRLAHNKPLATTPSQTKGDCHYCVECDAELSNRGTCKRRIVGVHVAPEKPVCMSCRERFKDKHKAKRHAKTFNGPIILQRPDPRPLYASAFTVQLFRRQDAYVDHLVDLSDRPKNMKPKARKMRQLYGLLGQEGLRPPLELVSTRLFGDRDTWKQLVWMEATLDQKIEDLSCGFAVVESGHPRALRLHLIDTWLEALLQDGQRSTAVLGQTRSYVAPPNTPQPSFAFSTGPPLTTSTNHATPVSLAGMSGFDEALATLGSVNNALRSIEVDGTVQYGSKRPLSVATGPAPQSRRQPQPMAWPQQPAGHITTPAKEQTMAPPPYSWPNDELEQPFAPTIAEAHAPNAPPSYDSSADAVDAGLLVTAMESSHLDANFGNHMHGYPDLNTGAGQNSDVEKSFHFQFNLEPTESQPITLPDDDPEQNASFEASAWNAKTLFGLQDRRGIAGCGALEYRKHKNRHAAFYQPSATNTDAVWEERDSNEFQPE